MNNKHKYMYFVKWINSNGREQFDIATAPRIKDIKKRLNGLNVIEWYSKKMY